MNKSEKLFAHKLLTRKARNFQGPGIEEFDRAFLHNENRVVDTFHQAPVFFLALLQPLLGLPEARLGQILLLEDFPLACHPP